MKSIMSALVCAAGLLVAAPTIAQADEAHTKALLDQAIQEGEVNYWDGVVQPKTADALTKAFLARYDLPSSFKVNITSMSPSNLVTRLQQEMAADRLTVDVVSVASLPLAYRLADEGKIMEYASPEYERFGKIFDAGFGKKDYFAFNGAYVFVPLWNPDNHAFEGTSWQDVLTALEKGRFSVGNGATSDSTISTYIGLRQALGVDYMKALAAKKPNFIPKSEAIASRVVSGEDLMAFMGMPTRAYQFNQKGANLKFLMPDEGVVLLPQATFIMNDAGHPAAAKLWVDFLMSEEGQTILVSDEAMVSGREGFKSPIPEYAPPIDDLNLVDIDWSKVTLEELQQARAEWNEIFGQ